MAKSITTIRQSLNYQSQHAAYLAANHALFNHVVAFYFAVIQAHENVLDLSTKEALTALERLTHATSKNRAPVIPLAEIAQDVPAMFRRAAIYAALGSARSFYTSLKKWRTRRELAEAKKARKGKWKKCTERPPVPPRTWNKPVPFYAGTMERAHRLFHSPESVDRNLLELDQGSHVRTRSARWSSDGQSLPGSTWEAVVASHAPREKVQQPSHERTGQCRLAARKIRHRDEQIAHLVSARIVQFAREQEATILVFEHLGNLKHEKGTYSHRGNSKRARHG